MLLLNEKRVQIDDLLNRMAQELQLDKTRFERMVQHYEAVQNWIESDEAFFGPHRYDLYPHGSVRIRTTVKPTGRDEFDLDIVIHLKPELRHYSPQRIYDELKRRLSENETYKKMLEPKKRCLRLNYSGDFHMDIMPGVQDNLYDENVILVPDRKLGTWVISNPKGYSKWFIDKANLVKVSLLEKAMSAEQIESDTYDNKKPLQRGVQLIKRLRDIYFQNDDTYKTSSIVLTTIAGEFYNGEESIYGTIDGIITRIRQKVSETHTRIKVFNPVNQEEDFTDKWDAEPEYYDAFRSFCDFLFSEWQKLKLDNGVIEESKILKGLFGESIFLTAQNKQVETLASYRKTDRLGISNASGILGSVGVESTKIPSNTFYGK